MDLKSIFHFGKARAEPKNSTAGSAYRFFFGPSSAGKLTPHDVMHIPALGFDGTIGYSPIAMAKNAIGLSMAAEEYGSKFYANGAAPGGVLEHPGVLKDPEKVRESWQAAFGGSQNANNVAVLEVRWLRLLLIR